MPSPVCSRPLVAASPRRRRARRLRLLAAYTVWPLARDDTAWPLVRPGPAVMPAVDPTSAVDARHVLLRPPRTRPRPVADLSGARSLQAVAPSVPRQFSYPRLALGRAAAARPRPSGPAASRRRLWGVSANIRLRHFRLCGLVAAKNVKALFPQPFTPFR